MNLILLIISITSLTYAKGEIQIVDPGKLGLISKLWPSSSNHGKVKVYYDEKSKRKIEFFADNFGQIEKTTFYNEKFQMEKVINRNYDSLETIYYLPKYFIKRVSPIESNGIKLLKVEEIFDNEYIFYTLNVKSALTRKLTPEQVNENICKNPSIKSEDYSGLVHTIGKIVLDESLEEGEYIVSGSNILIEKSCKGYPGSVQGIQRDVEKALNEGLACLAQKGNFARGEAVRLHALFNKNFCKKVKVDCERDISGAMGQATCGCGDSNHPKISLSLSSVRGLGEEERKALIFHEMLHLIGYAHGEAQVDLPYLSEVCCFMKNSTVPNMKLFQKNVCKVLDLNTEREILYGNPENYFWLMNVGKILENAEGRGADKDYMYAGLWESFWSKKAPTITITDYRRGDRGLDEIDTREVPNGLRLFYGSMVYGAAGALSVEPSVWTDDPKEKPILGHIMAAAALGSTPYEGNGTIDRAQAVEKFDKSMKKYYPLTPNPSNQKERRSNAANDLIRTISVFGSSVIRQEEDDLASNSSYRKHIHLHARTYCKELRSFERAQINEAFKMINAKLYVNVMTLSRNKGKDLGDEKDTLAYSKGTKKLCP